MKVNLAFALLLCGKLLGGRGAFRVHGGGFAGTVQAFVPEDMLEQFRAGIDSVLGAGSCLLRGALQRAFEVTEVAQRRVSGGLGGVFHTAKPTTIRAPQKPARRADHRGNARA